MEKTLFEQMGGTYRQVGDYLLPDFEEPQNEKSIGVWGQRHYNYLRKTNNLLLTQLLFSGQLNDYLADINCQADEMFSHLVNQLADWGGIMEALKATDQMEWVRRMNAVRDRQSSLSTAN